MSRFSHFFSQIFLRKRRYDDISVSIQEHLDERVDELMEDGMPRDEAERAARRDFGNVTLIQERSRETWQWSTLDSLRADLKYALRRLIKHPGFSVTAIMTLALGIGANVIVFSVLNALLLRPLNVSEPQRLYNVGRRNSVSLYQSYPDYLDYRDRNRTFSGMIAYDTTRAAISTGNATTKTSGYLVSSNYFDVLGIQPAVGRFFYAADENGPGSAPYIVLSHDFWHKFFHADSDIIGKTVDLNSHPFTVIGIASEQFHGTEIIYWPDFWIPIIEASEVGYGPAYLTNRAMHNPWILARLKPGVTPQQATEDLSAIAKQLVRQYPVEDDGLDPRLVKPGLMGDRWGGPIRGFMVGIMTLASLVLLAACTNLGSIFAARASDRSRELAIRLAIGSSRWVVLRGLLMEAVVISLAGGAAGTFLATVLLQMLSRWWPFADFPLHAVVLPDAKVYGLAFLLSLLSGILFGLLPARQILRSDAAQAMKSGAGARTGFRRFAARDVLLGVQIALCTLLVTASLVALRGLQRSLRAPLGFQPEGVMLAVTQLNMAGYHDDQGLPVQRRMLDEAASLPGVSSVGIIDRVLLGNGCCGSEGFFPEGTTDFRKEIAGAHNFSISPGYLKAAGTRLLSGREFTWHDDAKSPEVAIVNATFAHMLFGNAPAVGRHFLLFRATHPKEIVGVVEDGKYQSLTEEPQPAMFFPLAQERNSNDTVLVVRSGLQPAEMTASLNRIVTDINPGLPFVVRSWRDALDLALFPARAATVALGIMGVLAAMLAITGIFGMAAYSVSRRMKELGIRVALGAARVQLIRAALGRPLVLLFLGSATGLISGVLASRLLAQVVYEATPGDPLVLCGAIVTMTVLGLAATWIPARHAMAIDPARLLRDE